MSRLIRLAVSSLLLGVVAWRTDWPKFVDAFVALEVGWWWTGVLLFAAAQVVSTVRWQQMARGLQFQRPVKQMLGFYFIGMYFNLLLPTSVGGDVIRAWYLDGRSGRKLAAFMCVFLDRFSGLLVLLALACLGVLLSPVALEPWIVWSVYGMAGSCVAGLTLLPTVARWLRFGDRRVQTIRAALGILRQPGLLARTTFLSIIVQGLNVVIVWLIGVALGAAVPMAYYWVLVPMVSLLTMLPISVNGMGVREASMALLLAPMGAGENIALPLALLWFAATALVSLSGGLVYLFGRFPDPRASANVSEDSDGSIDRHPDQGRTGQPRTAA